MATLSARQIAAVAQRAGFKGRDVTIAVAVALAESGGRTDAVNTANRNGSRDYGLWQINTVHGSLLTRGSWSNPDDNARMAYTVFSQAGNSWRPWATYNSGRYLAFMGAASAASANPDGSTTPSGNAQTAGFPGSEQLDGILKFGQFVTDSNNWKRAGLFLMGGILLIIALMRMTGDNQLSGVTKSAIKLAATRGAVK